MGSNKDSLGDRMKGYEVRAKTFLPRASRAIIRVDGKAFHTYTRGLAKPFDLKLSEDMAKVTKHLCEKIQGAKFGYTQSDEISILLTDYDTIRTDAWFDYEVQKICSVSASMSASRFCQLRVLRLLENDTINNEATMMDAIESMRLGDFDARVFSLPSDEEVVNYFLWRQQDATRNSIQSVAQAHFSDKQLHCKDTDEMQDMLFKEKDVNWNDTPTYLKRGTAVVKTAVEMPNMFSRNPAQINKTEGDSAELPVITRSLWKIDLEMPVLTQDREYVLRVLPGALNTVKDA